MDGIADLNLLRAHYGPVHDLAAIKVFPGLDEHACAFIAISPFLVLATADASGRADASPRGDAPGFVLILSGSAVLIPDRPGDNRVDSYANLLERPGVGLLFFVPGMDETLRVNGRGRLVTDDDLLARAEAQGKVPRTGLLVDIDEVFFHCGKALRRSHLWDPARHVERRSFPSLGRIISDQTGAIAADVADSRIEDSYTKTLY